MENNIKIYNDDCLNKLKDIEDKSIDLVLIDPPYNIKKAKWDKWKTVNEYIEFMGKVFKECERVLKDNGSFYFFHNDFLQIVELQNWINKNTNFIFKSLLTINKNDNTYIKDLYGSKNHFRNYLNINEYCLYYTFQDESGLEKIPSLCFKPYLNYMTSEKEKINWDVKDFNNYLNYKSIASHWFWQDNKRTKQSQPRFISKKDYLKLQKTGYFQKTYEELRQEYEELRYTFNGGAGIENCLTYSFRTDKKYKHPTQKPLLLMEDLIKISSNKDDLILDCFMGSGSTGVACVNTGRKFIGIEKEEKYFNISKDRLLKAWKEKYGDKQKSD